MATFIFRCPCTGCNVQAHTEDNDKEGQTFETIACIACQQLHLVNPQTGKVAGEDDD
jgi:hypothetical protein